MNVLYRQLSVQRREELNRLQQLMVNLVTNFLHSLADRDKAVFLSVEIRGSEAALIVNDEGCMELESRIGAGTTVRALFPIPNGPDRNRSIRS